MADGASFAEYVFKIEGGSDCLAMGARATAEYLSDHATEIDPREIEVWSEIEAWRGDGRFFKIDAADYVIYVGVGKLLDQGRFVWVAGDYFPYRTLELENENGKTAVFLPPFVFKYLKSEITSAKQLQDALRREFYDQLRHGLSKAGYKCDQVFVWLDNVISKLGVGVAMEWPMQQSFEGYQIVGDHISKMNKDRLTSGADRLYEYLSTLSNADEIYDREGGTLFTISCLDEIFHVGIGELLDCGHFIWVAGDYFPYRVNKQRGENVVFTPPFVFKIDEDDLLSDDYQIKPSLFQREMCAQLLAGLGKAGYKYREVIYQLNNSVSESEDDSNGGDSDDDA